MAQEQDRDRLLEFFIEILRWKKFIIINFLVVVILAAGVSLVLPRWYKASASVLPPKDQSGLNFLGMASSSLRSLPLGQRLGSLTNQYLGAYNYLAILKSRTAMETIVRKYDLISGYGISDSVLDKAIKQLEKNVTFELQEENYISIEVLDQDPTRAAAIANSFIDILNSISVRLGTLEARNTKEFIERRLDQARTDLRVAEDSLRRYQETSGMVIAPDASPSNISSIAELYAMKAKKELELAVARRIVTQENETLQQLEREFDEIDKKLSNIPSEGIKSIRLYRNAAIQQKIIEYLLPLYEQAKVDEQKDIPVILVLDQAVPPEQRYSPKRVIIVATAGGISLLISFAIILLNLYFQRMRAEQPESYQRFLLLLDSVKPEKLFNRRHS
jgi:tyrosine-protein kinase Etk/Wzc